MIAYWQSYRSANQPFESSAAGRTQGVGRLSGWTMTATGPPDDPGLEFDVAAERGLTTSRAAGVAGVVFAILFFIALDLLGRTVGVALDTGMVMGNLSGSGPDPALEQRLTRSLPSGYIARCPG
jgi:hypothetical protein